MTFDDILTFLDHSNAEIRTQAGDVIAMALKSGVKKHVIDVETLNFILKDYHIHDENKKPNRLSPHPLSSDCKCWTCCDKRGEY